ncbi:MAG: formylglycine-generating enzyme family protein, partial [Candidatus Stygibacter australis]|nr:formylglycine-generating enzyme family protein [Candidatus Stygibacter australis]
VKITSDPAGAIVTIDSNMKLGVTPLESFYDAGTYAIRIEKENYETINEQITISEPETTKNYKMTDIRATLTVTTHKNATVTFNGVDYKGGIDKLLMLPQTISFKIEQEFCETIEETYTLKKGEIKVFELFPEDISATLTIKTRANATVKFNGKGYEGGIDNLVLLPQTISFKIEQEFCETIEETYTLHKGEKKVFELYPEDIAAILTVKTYDNATVKFKGESYKGGVSNKKLAPQVLEIEVTMPKAETLNRVITLKPKTEETIEMYSEVQTGVIQVMCIPTDAEIELTGDAGEHYTSIGRKSFTDVPVGKYDLIVSADGYKTHKEEFHLKADETIAKQILLEEGSDIPEGMVFVEGGTFQMGSTKGKDDEKPVHSETVSDFYISKYEVTVAEFKEFIDATDYITDAEKNGCSWIYDGSWSKKNGVTWKDDVNGNARNRSDYTHPVINVSWNDATAYCKWAEGRLPTEVEWEYAVRGGNISKGYKYSGSNKLKKVAWYNGNSKRKTHSAGGKQANELGIFDMSGNVYEWCWDWYGDYSSDPHNNPHGPSSGSIRVFRGGSWRGSASFCRTADRSYGSPGFSSDCLGFRIACSSK